MSSERVLKKETLGITVPLAPTIVIATFTLVNPEPGNSKPQITESGDIKQFMNVQRKNTGAWLTTSDKNDPSVQWVIGPDGLASPIGVSWTDNGPFFLKKTPTGTVPMDARIDDTAKVVGQPEGEPAFVFSKRYPNLIEAYTVFQVPPIDGLTPASFGPYIGKNQLISGKTAEKNWLTGRLALFPAITITDGSHLPFGRELKNAKS